MARPSILYGQVVKTNGGGLPVPVHSVSALEKGGFPPERLDELIGDLITNSEMGAALLAKYTPVLDETMEKLRTALAGWQGNAEPNLRKLSTVMGLVENFSRIMERISKFQTTAVKAKDDATRLRAFLVGSQSESNLDNLSEVQLRKMVAEAAAGWTKPDTDSSV